VTAYRVACSKGCDLAGPPVPSRVNAEQLAASHDSNQHNGQRTAQVIPAR
jgi:hypothetical protein